MRRVSGSDVRELRQPVLLLDLAHGREIVGHNGRTGGFCSTVGYNPEECIGVVVLSNASTPSGVDDIGLHLLNPKLPLANPEPPAPRTEIQIDPKLLDNYTGRYQVTPTLVFEITRDGGRLFAQGFAQLPQNRPGDLTGLPKFELFAEGEKNFFAKMDKTVVEWFRTGKYFTDGTILEWEYPRQSPNSSARWESVRSSGMKFPAFIRSTSWSTTHWPVVPAGPFGSTLKAKRWGLCCSKWLFPRRWNTWSQHRRILTNEFDARHPGRPGPGHGSYHESARSAQRTFTGAHEPFTRYCRSIEFR